MSSRPAPLAVAAASALLGALVAVSPAHAQAPGGAAAPAPDLKRGRLLYIQCRACHELKAGEPNKVGPNLHGFIGRKAAAVPDFAYSPALKSANLTWDRATLERWLEKPSAVVAGNSMAFAGIPNAADRASLIAYLEAETR
jgi:cytochrome c